MSDFPNLEQLGVNSIDEIIKYRLTREARVDVLKIYYKRASGSFLPQSRKYHFARGQNHIDNSSSSSTKKAQHVAPQLLLVIEELRTLMANKPIQKRAERKEALDERLASLEAVFESKLYHLRKQVEALND